MLDSPMQPLYEYVCHIKGHRNSNGELAEWVIKSHETGKILSSHKSEQKAKEHLQQMHIFNEATEIAGYPKLYHICGYMTGLDDDDIRDILTNGLRLHDNGESNCIWFSTGTPFSASDSVSRRPLVLSLECTPENIRKYRIDEYDVQANSPIVNVHENIPIEDLQIEQLAWGSIYRGENQVADIIDTRFYGNFERWARFDKDINIVIYEDLFNMWARNDIAKRGFNPDLNRLKEIMGDRLTITNFMEPKSDKLIGESTYGNDMNKRIKIFMEGVSQLGLNSSKLHTIEKLTQVCMESAMDEHSEPRYVSYLFQDEAERNDIERMIDADGNIDNVVSEYGFLLDPSNPDNVTEGVPYILEGTDIIIGTSGPYTLAYNGKMAGSYLLYKKLDDDSSTTNACMEGVGDGVDTQDIDPNMNELDEYTDTPPETVDGTEEDEEHELTMDEMYDKLIEQGVSQQTINIVTDTIGWNPDSMLKILYAATGYRTFDQLSEF